MPKEEAGALERRAAYFGPKFDQWYTTRCQTGKTVAIEPKKTIRGIIERFEHYVVGKRDALDAKMPITYLTVRDANNILHQFLLRGHKDVQKDKVALIHYEALQKDALSKRTGYVLAAGDGNLEGLVVALEQDQ